LQPFTGAAPPLARRADYIDGTLGFPAGEIPGRDHDYGQTLRRQRPRGTPAVGMLLFRRFGFT
jgi:hypothetical protein